MIGLVHYLVVSVVLFALGLYCVLARRNALGLLLGIALMLNAANINFVAFAQYGSASYDGPHIAAFVVMTALAQAVVGLAIILGVYRGFATIDVDNTNTLRG